MCIGPRVARGKGCCQKVTGAGDGVPVVVGWACGGNRTGLTGRMQLLGRYVTLCPGGGRAAAGQRRVVESVRP
jgi:hypothetical protein